MRLFVTLLLLASAAVAQQTPAPHWAFYRDEVHQIKITFSQSNWFEKLTKDYTDNDDVPYTEAAIEWGPYSFKSAGIRFKGNSSYNGATTQKKPFRIKLNEFVKGQKIDGIASFNLSNGWNDPSMIRETVYYNIASWAGFTAPRSNFAALTINGKYWGLYVLGEIVNGDFLSSRFPKDDKGNLYKAEIGATLEDRGDDPASYKEMFEKQSNEDKDDWSDIVQLATTLSRTPIESLADKMDAMLDVDSVLAGMAIDNLTVNLDSYIGQMAQNYFIYRRPSDNRFVWILYDPSLAFGAFNSGMTVEQMKQLSPAWTAASSGQMPGGGTPPQLPPDTPAPPNTPRPPDTPVPPGFSQRPGGGGQRPLFTRLMEVPKYRERYGQIYRWLVSEFLSADMVATRMNVLHQMVRPWLERDTQKLNTIEEFSKALTEDQTLAAGSRPGGVNPTPPADPNLPPGFEPRGGGGMGMSPGLQPFFRDRLDWVRTQVKLNSDGSWGVTP